MKQYSIRPAIYVVDQQLFTPDGLGLDCWKCCVAMLLNLPYDKVPLLLGGKEKGEEQMRLTQEFLATKGLIMKTGFTSHLKDIPTRYFIGSGVSPRSPEGKNYYHAVLCTLDDKGMVRVVHDPHPSRAGVRGDVDRFNWIVPIDERE